MAALLAAFYLYFYFMLALSFHAAPRSNLLLTTAYTVAAIGVSVAGRSISCWRGTAARRSLPSF